MKSMRKELMAAAAAAALIVGGSPVWAQSSGSSQEKMPSASGAQKPSGSTQMQGQGEMKTKPGSVQTQTQGGAKTGSQAQDDKSPSRSQQSQESGKNGAQQRPGQAQQPSDDARKQQTTESKPGSGKAAQLSSEQRTKISSTIREKDVNLKRVDRTDINFNINVGTVVPRTIGLAPLPAPIVAVVPAYRGYLYIVVGNDLLIVHPSTYEIVAVIPA